jgi:hypothetical protein
MGWQLTLALISVTATAEGAAERGPPTSAGDAFMRALGGIELSVLRGDATVQSSIRTEFGTDAKVASGKARQSGYRISTYASPTRTGFRLSPNLGFLDQRIRISDFREDLPLAGSGSGTDVAVTCSAPETGHESS